MSLNTATPAGKVNLRGTGDLRARGQGASMATLHTGRHGATSVADLDLADQPAFFAEGACLEARDPDTFHPAGEGNPGRPSEKPMAEAKAVCLGQCPVVEQCFKYAMDTRQKHGVWGGTSARERQQVFRRLDGRPELVLIAGAA